MKVIYYVLFCIILDVISGFIKSLINKKTISQTFYIGILKKFSIMVVICLSLIIDNVLNMKGQLYYVMNLFFIGCEGLSVLENLGQCGVPLPKKLTDALEVLTNKGNGGDKDV